MAGTTSIMWFHKDRKNTARGCLKYTNAQKGEKRKEQEDNLRSILFSWVIFLLYNGGWSECNGQMVPLANTHIFQMMILFIDSSWSIIWSSMFIEKPHCDGPEDTPTYSLLFRFFLSCGHDYKAQASSAVVWPRSSEQLTSSLALNTHARAHAHTCVQSGFWRNVRWSYRVKCDAIFNIYHDNLN